MQSDHRFGESAFSGAGFAGQLASSFWMDVLKSVAPNPLMNDVVLVAVRIFDLPKLPGLLRGSLVPGRHFYLGLTLLR